MFHQTEESQYHITDAALVAGVSQFTENLEAQVYHPSQCNSVVIDELDELNPVLIAAKKVLLLKQWQPLS